jgi:hypothetical protein
VELADMATPNRLVLVVEMAIGLLFSLYAFLVRGKSGLPAPSDKLRLVYQTLWYPLTFLHMVSHTLLDHVAGHALGQLGLSHPLL